MAKIEGQGPLSSTKQTPWILKVCTHYSEDFCPNMTEIRPVSPIPSILRTKTRSNVKFQYIYYRNGQTYTFIRYRQYLQNLAIIIKFKIIVWDTVIP